MEEAMFAAVGYQSQGLQEVLGLNGREFLTRLERDVGSIFPAYDP